VISFLNAISHVLFVYALVDILKGIYKYNVVNVGCSLAKPFLSQVGVILLGLQMIRCYAT
jgi:hypothetical protein